MIDQRNRLLVKLQEYIGVIPSVYRFLAFATAAAHIFIFTSAYYSIIPPLILVSGVGIYTLFKMLHPLRWYQGGILGPGLLGVDIVACIFLVMSTGGLYSPFLLYTLAPVLTAALLLNRGITFTTAIVSIVYVITSQRGNPFFPTPLTLAELGYFMVYTIAVCLAGALPYLTNVNLRERLQREDILQERQRLSHEIHDGTAQTLSALRWQVQLLRRHLAEMGIKLDEASELERLIEKAHQDTRASLELLHNHTHNGSLLPDLQVYLERYKEDTGIDFRLDLPPGEFHLEEPVQLELSRICQEALTNVKKHSGASNIQVKVKSVNNHLEVSITDDGRGFDALAHYRDGIQAKGHGLAVMRERAESIGGRFRVLSLPGRGTEIQVEVPLNARWSKLLWVKR